MSRLLLLLATLAAHAAFAAQDQSAIVQPIPELKLTNGATFRNVTIVRYEKERVVLKSSSGVGPLGYNMIPEPLRSRMITERDGALSAKAEAERAQRVAAAEGERQQQEKEAQAAAARAAFRERVEDAIRRRVLIVGMTPADAVRSWGDPVRRNTSGGAHGSHEQWVFASPEGTTYVYFDEGKLTSWQQSERR